MKRKKNPNKSKNTSKKRIKLAGENVESSILSNSRNTENKRKRTDNGNVEVICEDDLGYSSIMNANSRYNLYRELFLKAIEKGNDQLSPMKILAHNSISIGRNRSDNNNQLVSYSRIDNKANLNIFCKQTAESFLYFKKLNELSKILLRLKGSIDFMVHTRPFDSNVWSNILSFLEPRYIKIALGSPIVPKLANGSFMGVKEHMVFSKLEITDVERLKSLNCVLVVKGDTYFPVDTVSRIYTIRKLKYFTSLVFGSIDIKSIPAIYLDHMFHQGIKSVTLSNVSNLKYFMRRISTIKNVNSVHIGKSKYSVASCDDKTRWFSVKDHPRIRWFSSNFIKLKGFEYHRSLKHIELSDPSNLIAVLKKTCVIEAELREEVGIELKSRKCQFDNLTTSLLKLDRNKLKTFRYLRNIREVDARRLRKIIYLLYDRKLVKFEMREIQLSLEIIKYGSKRNGYYILLTKYGAYMECKRLLQTIINITNNKFEYPISDSISIDLKINICPSGQSKWCRVNKYKKYQECIMVSGKYIDSS